MLSCNPSPLSIGTYIKLKHDDSIVRFTAVSQTINCAFLKHWRISKDNAKQHPIYLLGCLLGVSGNQLQGTRDYNSKGRWQWLPSSFDRETSNLLRWSCLSWLLFFWLLSASSCTWRVGSFLLSCFWSWWLLIEGKSQYGIHMMYWRWKLKLSIEYFRIILCSLWICVVFRFDLDCSFFQF